MWPFDPPSTYEKIRRLRNKCRKDRMAYYEAYEWMDCGHDMAQVISPRMRKLALRYNENYKKLVELDPEAPPHIRLASKD